VAAFLGVAMAWQARGAALSCDSDQVVRLSASQPAAGALPVIFIHGITGDPTIWTHRELNGDPSIADRVKSIPGTTVWTFNYHKVSLNWVTDPAIGPAFARSISCLAHLTGRRVIVIAHSMGGLATQYAAAQQDPNGGTVGSDIARVIAIGTPFEGSKALSAAQIAVNGGEDVSDPALASVVEALLSKCAGLSEADLALNSGNPCSLLGVLRSPVGRDLMYHSAAIAALPPWASSVPVSDIAGEIDVTVGVWPLLHTFNVGDLAVSQDSATAHNTSGSPLRFSCHDAILKILETQCYHSRLPWNTAIVDDVASEVRHVVQQQQPRTPKPAPEPAPTTTQTASPAPQQSSSTPTTTKPPSATQPLSVGSPFDDECVVVWPTAPVRTSHDIEMTMSCAHVPEGQFLFTQVVYGDPNLPITPSTGKVHVVGQVVDVATSSYGYRELVVQATTVSFG
jgi:pimeloyl-ACP methyl ester carboxylesterase